MSNTETSTVPRKQRVLVIDDEAIICDPLVASLTSAGYEAISTLDAVEGLRIAESWKPDLFVLDIHMPKMDGLALLSTLRMRPATAYTPVVLLTVEHDRNYVIQAGKLGVKEYILKSRFTLKHFLERVE